LLGSCRIACLLCLTSCKATYYNLYHDSYSQSNSLGPLAGSAAAVTVHHRLVVRNLRKAGYLGDAIGSTPPSNNPLSSSKAQRCGPHASPKPQTLFFAYRPHFLIASSFTSSVCACHQHQSSVSIPMSVRQLVSRHLPQHRVQVVPLVVGHVFKGA
jgi:hypothetical protein